MATIPVPNALVRVNPDNVTSTESTHTNVNGIAEVSFELSEDEYSRINIMSISAMLGGYNDANVEFSNMPSYELAKQGGIEVLMTMTKKAVTPIAFYVEPSRIEFGADGGTTDLTVTCPDNSWSVYRVLYDGGSEITATKINSTTIRVVCPASSTAREGSIQVLWNNPDSGPQYQYAYIAQTGGAAASTITFRGTLINDTTGQPIATTSPDDVGIFAWNSLNSSTQSVAQSLTNSQGVFSVSAMITQVTWDQYGRVFAIISPNGYESRTITINPAPSFASAVANGVDFGTIRMTPIAGETGVVIITGRVVDLDTNNGVPNMLVAAFGIGANPDELIVPSYTDSAGYFSMRIETSRSEWERGGDTLSVWCEWPDWHGPFVGMTKTITKPSWANASTSGVDFGIMSDYGTQP